MQHEVKIGVLVGDLNIAMKEAAKAGYKVKLSVTKPIGFLKAQRLNFEVIRNDKPA